MRGVDLMETSDQISRVEEQTNEVIEEVRLAPVGLTAGPSMDPSGDPITGPSVGLSGDPSTGPSVVPRKHGKRLVSKLRLASWNIETLTEHLLRIFHRRKVDIACIQDNNWAGNRACEIDGWKVWYSGKSESKNGVGVIVSEKLRDQVVRVEHRNDWLMRVKLEIEGAILNVISAYVPQESLGEEVKRRFWKELGDLVRGIPKTEHFVVGGDFNGHHIGRSKDGYTDAHGGFGFGDRNDSGVALLNFSASFGCIIANSLFRKKDVHLITFETTTCSCQNNYFVVRREDRNRCRDCKVIPCNGLKTPYRLLVLDLNLPYGKRKKKKRTHVTQPVKRTSWWTEEVRVKLKAKKMAYRSWRTSTSEEEKERRLLEYKTAKKEAKRVVAKAQEAETMKTTQLISGAHVKVVPPHPPGDTSTERSVYMNDVMGGNRPRTYSGSTGYTQATYPQSGGWAPQGQPPVHHQQQAGYAILPPYYSGYPPPRASWDQTNPSTVPPQPQQATGYNTYGQQQQQQQPVRPTLTPPSIGYNYNQAPPSSYNYNQGYAQHPPYGQDTTVSAEQQKPYADPNAAYSQPPPLPSQPGTFGQTSRPDAGTGYAQQGATYPGYGPPPASYNQGGGYQQMGYGQQQQGAAQAGPIHAPYPYYGQGPYPPPPPPSQASYYPGGYPPAPGHPPVQGQYGISHPPSY